MNVARLRRSIRTPEGRETFVVVIGLWVSLGLRLAYAQYLSGGGGGVIGGSRPGDAYVTGMRGVAVGTDWIYGTVDAGIDRFVATSQPPLFTVLLALVRQLVHGQSRTAIVVAALTTVTVGLVWWTARREFGRSAGYVALIFGGLYVDMITQGGMLMSEALAQLLAAALLLVVPVAVRDLRLLSAAVAGGLCALLLLTRSELALLVPVVGLALVVAGFRRFGWTQIGRQVAVPAIFGAMVLITVAPWAYYTTSVLGRPVPSTGSGFFQLATSCPTSLSGDLVGYRDASCLFEARGYLLNPANQQLTLGRTVDNLYVDELGKERAAEVLAESDVNINRVRLLRVARGFGLYRPFQSARLEASEGAGGPVWLADVQVVQWLTLLVLAAPGLVVARRRRMPLAAVLGLGAAAVAALALGFGLSRYRAAFDPAVVLMASAGAVGLWQQLRLWLSSRSA